MTGPFPKFTAEMLALFARHQAWAEQIAQSVHRQVPPSFDLDDIRQRALLGLAEAITKYEACRGTPFGAFAFRYVCGGAWMAVRRREYVERTHAELPAQLEVAAPEPVDDDRWERLQEAMERLPARHRWAILDHWFMGRPVPAPKLEAAMRALRAEVRCEPAAA